MYLLFFYSFYKLDGVGSLITDPLSICFTTLSEEEEKNEEKNDMWHVTHDMWHVAFDMWRDMWRETWHMTCDMFGGMNILSKFQLPSSSGLWLMILWISGGKGWFAELINYEAVYRTAPATPGLLNVMYNISNPTISFSITKNVQLPQSLYKKQHYKQHKEYYYCMKWLFTLYTVYSTM